MSVFFKNSVCKNNISRANSSGIFPQQYKLIIILLPLRPHHSPYLSTTDYWNIYSLLPRLSTPQYQLEGDPITQHRRYWEV